MVGGSRDDCGRSIGLPIGEVGRSPEPIPANCREEEGGEQ